MDYDLGFKSQYPITFKYYLADQFRIPKYIDIYILSYYSLLWNWDGQHCSSVFRNQNNSFFRILQD